LNSPPLHRVILAASIGNALEWFDFLIYGYFAVTISKLFFPTGNEAASLLLALGTFGASYLVRQWTPRRPEAAAAAS
jgi:MFS transporter, MHS family, proline/betaine transporter